MNRSKKQATHRRKLIDRLPKANAPELYHVIVQCTDEVKQRELYQRLTREGLSCRVVVL